MAARFRLHRYHGNPIVRPHPGHPWEDRKVFNAGITQREGLVYMVYRAQGQRSEVSRLGLAVSTDGFDFWRLDKAVFWPEGDFEAQGVEDPRLTPLDGHVYMAYTGFSGAGIRVCLARTTNFFQWERLGVVIPDVDNKDAALFPRAVRGRYAMLHRIPDDIWIAHSNDLRHWEAFQIVMRPRPSRWDSRRIGAAGPPLEVEEGWLLIYHGFNEERVYCLGLALLDRDDPSRVLARLDEPILVPKWSWERRGDVPNVVFSCGQAIIGDRLLVYYGGADRTLAVATGSLTEARRALRREG